MLTAVIITGFALRFRSSPKENGSLAHRIGDDTRRSLFNGKICGRTGNVDHWILFELDVSHLLKNGAETKFGPSL